MVQMMKNGKSVKVEVEDHLEEEHGPLNKRQKQSLRMGSVAASASQYNPLDEPSPLGLRLRKSPSLLELIQMKLSQSSTAKAGGQSQGKKQSTGGGSSGDKLKASNFPASILLIGTWEYKSRYEGDLVAKCYFAKHKLVWEVLDGGLKNKIEIQWSDIMALKAAYPDDGPGTLDVVLARQPLFFRETNPQPRKHTLWQATSDFTGGQASIQRRHYLECPQGLLGKHFEKLIQCDPRLNFLSQQGDIVLDSRYFEPRIPVFDDQNEETKEYDLNREGSPSIFSLHEATSPSGVQSSSSKTDQDVLSRYSADTYPHETPSPCSGMSTLTVEDIKNGGLEQLKTISNWDQIKVPGIRPSMSMTDLVSHLEIRISEQGPSEQPNLSSEEWESFQILEDINRCLFSDFQNMPDSDEKSLMSRVNSLCCLLQKDPVTKAENHIPFVQNAASTEENGTVGAMNNENGVGKIEGKQSIPPNESANGISLNNESGSMSRNDSVGDLLLNLPRIASLPQFLFNISEDFESKAR